MANGIDAVGVQVLPECRRREIFELLVVAQDYDVTVTESRRMVASFDTPFSRWSWWPMPLCSFVTYARQSPSMRMSTMPA